MITRIVVPDNENAYAFIVNPTDEDRLQLKLEGYFFWTRYKIQKSQLERVCLEELWLKSVEKEGEMK